MTLIFLWICRAIRVIRGQKSPPERPAPIQVSWLAFPGSMGVPFIDYLIVDETVVPLEEAREYDEALAYLPDTYQPLDFLRQSDPSQTRSQIGLPEEAFVFCCFNNPYKYTPEHFDCWCRLLQAAPHAILWLFAPRIGFGLIFFRRPPGAASRLIVLYFPFMSPMHSILPGLPWLTSSWIPPPAMPIPLPPMRSGLAYRF